MRRTLSCLLAAIGLVVLAAPPADARRLLQDVGLEAHVLDGPWCAETVYVELRAASQESFGAEALQVRQAVAGLANALALECAPARQLELLGTVSGLPVWRATASVSTGVVRELGPPEPGHLVPIGERQRVREIQQALNTLGYDVGPADGVMGPRTRAAILRYRQATGEAPVAEASAELLIALRAEVNPAFAKALAEPPPGAPSEEARVERQQASALRYQATDEVARLVLEHHLVSLDGRLAVPGNVGAPEHLSGTDLGPLFDRLALRTAPEMAATDTTALEFFGLLSLEQRRELVLAAIPELNEREISNLDYRDWRLTRRDASQIGLNEFQVQRILHAFRARGQADLIAQAPSLPLPIVVVCGAQLSDFNFVRNRFAVSELDKCDRVAVGTRRVAAHISTAGFPAYLEMTPEEAEQLRTRLQGERRIYAAIEATIKGLTSRNGARRGFELAIERERLTLYEDAQLQAALWQAELGDSPAVVLAGDLLFDPRRLVVSNDRYSKTEGDRRLLRYLDLLALAAAPEILDDERTAYHYMEWLSEPQRRELLERAGLDYEHALAGNRSLEFVVRERLDEFARRRLVDLFRSNFAQQLVNAAPPLPLSLLLRCDVGVAEYDFDRSLFAFARDLDRACGRLEALGNNSRYSAGISMAGAPEGVAVSLPEAPAFREEHLIRTQQIGQLVSRSDPTARLGIELSVVGVKLSRETRGAPSFAVEIEVEGILLFSAADDARAPVKRLEFTPQEHGGDVAASAQSVPKLDELSAVLLLMLGNRLFEPSEAEWRKWAAARARAEAEGDATWRPFFGDLSLADNGTSFSEPLDADLLHRFQAWTRARAGSLAEDLRLEMSAAPVSEDERQQSSIFPFPRQNHPIAVDLAERLSLPAAHLHLVDVRDAHDLPKPLTAVVLVLPAAKDQFTIPVDAARLPAGSLVTSDLFMKLGNLRLVPLGSMKLLVLDAVPLSGRVLAARTGEELGSAAFATETAGGLAKIDFPPEGYAAVVHAAFTGRNPVETIYEALDYRLDAFERRQRAEALVAAAQQYAPQDHGFWVVGRADYGDYDFTAEVFPLRSVTLEEFARSHAKAVTLYPPDRSQLNVHMPPDEAREWQRGNPSHPRYALRARVTPESVSAKTIRVKIREFELLQPEVALSVRDPAQVLYAAVLDKPRPEALSALAEGEDGPEGGGASPEPGSLDILGIRLGQEIGEATARLKQELEKPVIYRTNRSERVALLRSNLWEPFNEAIMIRSGNGRDAVVLYSEPPAAARRVTAISRWVDLGRGGPPMAAVAELLVARYGEAVAYHERENAILLAWYDEQDLPDYGSCATDLAMLARREWRVDVLPWHGPGGPARLPEASALHPGGPAYDIAEPGAFPFTATGLIGRSNLNKCPQTLFALVVAGHDGRARRILTGISDPIAVAQTADANRAEMIKGEDAEAAAAIELKF